MIKILILKAISFPEHLKYAIDMSKQSFFPLSVCFYCLHIDIRVITKRAKPHAYFILIKWRMLRKPETILSTDEISIEKKKQSFVKRILDDKNSFQDCS